jgi:hypothetical protein
MNESSSPSFKTPRIPTLTNEKSRYLGIFTLGLIIGAVGVVLAGELVGSATKSWHDRLRVGDNGTTRSTTSDNIPLPTPATVTSPKKEESRVAENTPYASPLVSESTQKSLPNLSARPSGAKPAPVSVFGVTVLQKIEGEPGGLLCLDEQKQKAILVVGYPGFADVADGDNFYFRGYEEGTYSYINTVGSRATVRRVKCVAAGYR